MNHFQKKKKKSIHYESDMYMTEIRKTTLENLISHWQRTRLASFRATQVFEGAKKNGRVSRMPAIVESPRKRVGVCRRRLLLYKGPHDQHENEMGQLKFAMSRP